MARKRAAIPKTIVEEERRARYDRALEVKRRERPDMTLSDYIREAMDRAANEDLEAQG